MPRAHLAHLFLSVLGGMFAGLGYAGLAAGDLRAGLQGLTLLAGVVAAMVVNKRTADRQEVA